MTRSLDHSTKLLVSSLWFSSASVPYLRYADINQRISAPASQKQVRFERTSRNCNLIGLTTAITDTQDIDTDFTVSPGNEQILSMYLCSI